MITYRNLFHQAFRFTLRNPGLLFFGFFVAILGVGGELDILLQSLSLGQNSSLLAAIPAGLAEAGLLSADGLRGFLQAGAGPLLLFTTILLSLLVFIVVGLWFVFVTQGALIALIGNRIHGEKMTWRQAYAVSIKRFWSIFAVNFAVTLTVWLVFAGLNWLAFWLKFAGFAPLYIVGMTLSVVVGLIGKYTLCSIMLTKSSLQDALAKSLRIFRENWLTTLEIALILLLLFALYAGIVGVALSLFSPTIFTGFLFTLDFAGAFNAVLLVVAFFGLFAMMPLAVFHWTVWIIMYEALSSERVLLMSKVMRMFKNIS